MRAELNHLWSPNKHIEFSPKGMQAQEAVQEI